MCYIIIYGFLKMRYTLSFIVILNDECLKHAYTGYLCTGTFVHVACSTEYDFHIFYFEFIKYYVFIKSIV